MPSLPYDEYEGDGELPDDWNREVYEDYAMADTVYEAMEEWRHGPGGDTWTQEQWFDMIHEVDNFVDWVDDEGNYHYSFDFMWESEDGYYFGGGHMSG